MLCTYNGGRYLADQLASLSAQTRLPDILFVRDDGSTDETTEILRSFGASAPFPVDVRCNPDRLGYNLNFSSVLAEPATDLIALCDQDDIWYSQKLQVLCRLLADDTVAAGACADARRIAGDGRSLGSTVWQRLGFDAHHRHAMSATGELGPLLRNNVIPGSSLVLRSSFRDLLLPFSEHGFYDLWTAVLLQTVSYLAFAPEPLQEYRVHDQNAVGLDRPRYSLRRAARRRRRHVHEERAVFSREVLERASASRYPIRPDTRARLDDWVAFNTFRANLPSHLIRRGGDVARELRRGGYASYGGSAMSAIYDLLLG